MRSDDVAFALSGPGGEALAWVDSLDFGGSSRVYSSAAVRERYGERAAALIDLSAGRRKAVAKLRPESAGGSGSKGWVLGADAAEQATPWQVAHLRARRLSGRAVHDLTCSVGAELAELTRECPAVLGSDLDPARAAMARHNVPGALVAVADALAPATRPDADLVHIADPGRRSGGRRIADPAALEPPLPALLDVLAGRDFAVKCAPGLDYAALAHGGETEIVSLGGGVKEACLWSGSLSDGVGRRATVIHPASRPAAGTEAGAPSRHGDGPSHPADFARALDGGGWFETVTDLDPEIAAADPDPETDRFLIEPDGAIVRAGLVRHWAFRHGLRQLDPRIAHLTGAELPAGYSGFEVLERHGLDLKALRARFRELDCGSLEILVRGVDKDPDALRKKLGLKGKRPLALVISRVGERAVAYICDARRHETPPSTKD